MPIVKMTKKLICCGGECEGKKVERQANKGKQREKAGRNKKKRKEQGLHELIGQVEKNKQIFFGADLKVENLSTKENDWLRVCQSNARVGQRQRCRPHTPQNRHPFVARHLQRVKTWRKKKNFSSRTSAYEVIT